jgi:glycosyltransferase involved in cell wall biosynthesis
MKIFINKLNESWIVDRLRKEWYENNVETSSENIKESDIVWIIAPWTWKKVSKKQLKQKIVVCTIHHLNHELNSKSGYQNFIKRDKYVNYYHVITEKSKNELQKITYKPIFVSEFWLNQKLFFQIKDRGKLREKYNLSSKDFLIGSFQRDTEGKDLISPKLIKGPDIFIEILKNNFLDQENLKIILTGKRRAYIIEQLEKLNIEFLYFEMVTFKELNELYNLLDLYIVSSRKEGGPQQILEAAITKTPIVSTNVGLADLFLSPESIYNLNEFSKARPNTEYAFNKIDRLLLPDGLKSFKNFFKQVYDEN